jgi:hypothetical protein
VAAGAWLRVLRRYFLVVALASLAWEFAHLPLYTVWWEGTFGAAAFAAVHCTGGDLLIAASSLLLALLLLGAPAWPERGFARVAAATILFGVGYTAFSEWLNTEVRGSWRYTELMPTLPPLGTGLSPLAQWMVIPLAAFWWVRRPAAYP